MYYKGMTKHFNYVIECDNCHLLMAHLEGPVALYGTATSGGAFNVSQKHCLLRVYKALCKGNVKINFMFIIKML